MGRSHRQKKIYGISTNLIVQHFLSKKEMEIIHLVEKNQCHNERSKTYILIDNTNIITKIISIIRCLRFTAFKTIAYEPAKKSNLLKLGLILSNRKKSIKISEERFVLQRAIDHLYLDDLTKDITRILLNLDSRRIFIGQPYLNLHTSIKDEIILKNEYLKILKKLNINTYIVHPKEIITRELLELNCNFLNLDLPLEMYQFNLPDDAKIFTIDSMGIHCFHEYETNLCTTAKLSDDFKNRQSTIVDQVNKIGKSELIEIF